MGRLGSPWCGLPPEVVKETQVGNVLDLMAWARDKLRERAEVVDEAMAILTVELGAKGELPWLEGSTFASALAMNELRKMAVASEWQVLPQPCAVLGVKSGSCPSNEQQHFIVTAATQESECQPHVHFNERRDSTERGGEDAVRAPLTHGRRHGHDVDEAVTLHDLFAPEGGFLEIGEAGLPEEFDRGLLEQRSAAGIGVQCSVQDPTAGAAAERWCIVTVTHGHEGPSNVQHKDNRGARGGEDAGFALSPRGRRHGSTTAAGGRGGQSIERGEEAGRRGASQPARVSSIVEETAPLGESGASQGWVDGQTSDDEWYRNTLKSRLEAEFAKLCADSGAVRAVVQANVDLLVQGALE